MEGSFGDRDPDARSARIVGCGKLQGLGNRSAHIDLESIRDKDEDYWDEYGGIPKAFIPFPGQRKCGKTGSELIPHSDILCSRRMQGSEG